MSRRPSIAFVAPHALPALRGVAGEPMTEEASGAGGAELQQAMLGRELAARGHRVVMVVDAGAGTIPARIAGIELVGCAWRTGARGEDDPGRGPAMAGRLSAAWRFVRRASSVAGALARASCEIYVARSNHLGAALTGRWCEAVRTPFIFAAGHDGNCDPALAHRPLRPAVARAYASALRSASAVVLQTRRQVRLMQRSFGVSGLVIPSAAPEDAVVGSRQERGGVLWVGTLEPRKGFDRLLQIAALAPGVGFTAVGGPGDHPRYVAGLSEAASRARNLRRMGPLDRRRTLELMATSAIYLNTSRSEGFPNTFLEAWASGTPILSQQIDPDEVLERGRLGLLTGDVARTAEEILGLLGNPRRRDDLARAGLLHVRSCHRAGDVADRWEDLLGRAAEGIRVEGPAAAQAEGAA